MFAGPIIAREVLTAPRPARFYIARASFVALMFILMWTAWQSLVGWSDITEVGIIARFGGILFQLFVLLQLTLMLFFAPLAAATAVAHEKDRRTFVLLLMTDLRDIEIVLGKLVASLLQIVTFLLTSAPVLFLCILLGGVSAEQVVDVLGVTAAAGIAGGSIGLLVGLWRDRTFQSLALTVLVLTLGLAIIELIGFVFPSLLVAGVPFASALNPYRVVINVLNPIVNSDGAIGRPSLAFIITSISFAALLIGFGVYKLRVWNPGRNEPREAREGQGEVVEQLIEIPEQAATTTTSIGTGATLSDTEAPTTGLHIPRRAHRRITGGPRPYRTPWSNPILWRELMTRAYGTKPMIIKGAYLVVFSLAVSYFYANPNIESDPWRPAKTLIPIAVLSLLLINAQGVTSLTSERDTGALDLLLVTELSPKQFIYGKLYGVLYNTKEMVALPILLAIWFMITGKLSFEQMVYVILDFAMLAHFSAMLGIHAAITYINSRTAVANSLGTIFFLMVGIGICAFLIILSDQEFGRQLLSFLIFIGAGSVALFSSLGAKNPSNAIALVALLTPFWSFYCVISLLNGDLLAAFLFSMGIYGFALLAMLVPAVSDFDIALGRTSAIQG